MVATMLPCGHLDLGCRLRSSRKLTAGRKLTACRKLTRGHIPTLSCCLTVRCQLLLLVRLPYAECPIDGVIRVEERPGFRPVDQNVVEVVHVVRDDERLKQHRYHSHYHDEGQHKGAAATWALPFVRSTDTARRGVTLGVRHAGLRVGALAFLDAKGIIVCHPRLHSRGTEREKEALACALSGAREDAAERQPLGLELLHLREERERCEGGAVGNGAARRDSGRPRVDRLADLDTLEIEMAGAKAVAIDHTQD
mmetsp:Transcript_58700/g.116569  ORF Transcript_58700/g.116569 Transcript_58700/m.116569 type:complete len:253 (-) Transcript_58700:4639-5397(-)